MTLLVRDEADLVEPWLRYHYARGVDFVVATDHRSQDGTTDLLREEERRGRLALIREDAEDYRQQEWVTRMARLAATMHGADWVVHADADELWWPRGGSFHELLAAVPARFGVVRGLWRHFVLRPEGDGPFWERMTVRTRPSADLSHPYHGQVKVAHRAVADAEVSQGAHDAYGRGLELVREWLPFEILHFPLRSASQLREKFGRRARVRDGQHTVEAVRRLESEGADALHRSLEVDDLAVEAGVAAGSLVVDTRLRDALRSLATGASELPDWVPTLRDEADLAQDADVTLAHDAWVRLPRRAARLQRSLARLEESLAVRASLRGDPSGVPSRPG